MLRTRSFRGLSAVPLALLATLALGQAAQATPSNQDPQGATVKLGSGRIVSTDPTKRTNVEETAYRDEITRLEVEGKLDDTNMRRMGLQLLSAPSTAASPPAAATWGRLGSASPSTASTALLSAGCSITNAQTSASAMAVYAPKITVNYSSSGYVMYANSTFQWSSPPAAPSTCQTDVGGNDGFAFAFNRAVTNLGVSFSACNSYGKCGSYGWLETNSQYRAGYSFQDKAGSVTVGYSPAYKGTITYAFRTGSGCTQAFAKYAHTWSSTSVNGFSIGPSSIGVQWSTSSGFWQKSGQAGSYGTC